jgi:DNA-directed RNA polymerase
VDFLLKSRQRNEERYQRRNALRRRDKLRSRPYCALPEGVEVVSELFIQHLADFFAGKLDIKPDPPPDELNWQLGQLNEGFGTPDLFYALALATLSPLLDPIVRDWKHRKSERSQRAIVERMGRHLRDWLALYRLEISGNASDKRLFDQIRRGKKPAWKHLKSEWSRTECVAVGHWMLDCATRMPYFVIADDGLPRIAPKYSDKIDRLREVLLWRHPVIMPHLRPPPDWTGWWANYGDRLRASFVSDWRPETRAAIEATFETARPPDDRSSPFAAALRHSLPFAHADGVNSLQRVPLRINQTLLPLVDKFAVELMDNQGKQRETDRDVVAADLADARWIGDRQFYLTYHCDKRGRIYAIPHLNYLREDHVRSLFKFANGQPIGDGLQWLEIHCANSAGEDKKPWHERLQWAKTNHDMIECVAADPQNTFDLWRGADKPFAFVAACQELVGAWHDQAGFITHLPVSFDGTCNGIQHLALLARDKEAAKLVNLIDSVPTHQVSATPQDIYEVVRRRIMELLEIGDKRLRSKKKEIDDAWCFGWWRERLRSLNKKDLRKLFKNPAMTFAYSATNKGMEDKIVEVYRGLFELNEPWPEATRFLAKAVRLACQDILPGPARVMKHIRALALHRFKRGLFLEWRTLTGFPVANRYELSNEKEISLVTGGIRTRYTVADGALPKKMKRKILDAASPNFVHSLDAAHLVRTVLGANSDGIKDILTVHDSFACLASQATRFNQIIRRDLSLLYIIRDPLANLREVNVGDADVPPPPKHGDLTLEDVLKIQTADYPFM